MASGGREEEEEEEEEEQSGTQRKKNKNTRQCGEQHYVGNNISGKQHYVGNNIVIVNLLNLQMSCALTCKHFQKDVSMCV